MKKDFTSACYVSPIKKKHYKLSVFWSNNLTTVSCHETQNEAEAMAIAVLTSSGNIKNGRALNINIEEQVGCIPNPNPHGI
jgi:hypothetical protein